MKYQLKTYDNKILIELTITENGSEFYLSSEVKTLKDKITNANKEHGLQLETDIRNLSLLKYSSNCCLYFLSSLYKGIFWYFFCYHYYPLIMQPVLLFSVFVV